MNPTDNDTTDTLRACPAGGAPNRAHGQARVLIVGGTETWAATLRAAAPGSVVALPFPQVTARAIAEAMPDWVLTPLLGRGFDVLDVAARLATIGYRGVLGVVCGALPDAEAVAREVQGQVPEIRVSLIRHRDGR